MKQIVFLNRFFCPDESATSQLVSDLAFHLAGAGYDVHAIASRQRYDDPRADLAPIEAIRGVTVHRIATTRFGRSMLIGRGLDYASFYALVRRKLDAVARPGAIVVAKTDPPMLGAVAMRAGAARRCLLVNWLQDLYPEVAMRLGVPFMNGMLGARLLRLRDASLMAAAANVAIGERMAANLRRLGVPEDRIRIIPNWCEDETVQPTPDKGAALRRAWGLEGRFVVGYSGNLGRAHEFETVLGAARLLSSEAGIAFLVVGSGPKIEELARRVVELRLQASFRFMPYQAEETLTEALSVPDLHWISLKPELEGLIVPSKFYRIAAVGRPMVVIGARDGELGALVQRHACGLVVEPGDAQGLADLLKRLAGDPQGLAAMGKAARALLDAQFSRARALESWRQLIGELASTVAPVAATLEAPTPGVATPGAATRQ
jgi:glycosyltransferase involved in cell wall biosynthesis